MFNKVKISWTKIQLFIIPKRMLRSVLFFAMIMLTCKKKGWSGAALGQRAARKEIMSAVMRLRRSNQSSLTVELQGAESLSLTRTTVPISIN